MFKNRPAYKCSIKISQNHPSSTHPTIHQTILPPSTQIHPFIHPPFHPSIQSHPGSMQLLPHLSTRWGLLPIWIIWFLISIKKNFYFFHQAGAAEEAAGYLNAALDKHQMSKLWYDDHHIMISLWWSSYYNMMIIMLWYHYHHIIIWWSLRHLDQMLEDNLKRRKIICFI